MLCGSNRGVAIKDTEKYAGDCTGVAATSVLCGRVPYRKKTKKRTSVYKTDLQILRFRYKCYLERSLRIIMWELTTCNKESVSVTEHRS